MERFSNSRTAYWDQIIHELSGPRSESFGELRFRYTELGQLLTHAFSISQFDPDRSKLILLSWNAAYDNARFDKGIYNLDRLSIKRREIKLEAKEMDLLTGHLEAEFALTGWDGITLDGLFCRLEFGDKKIEWNSDHEINENLCKLIDFFRNKAGREFDR
ncbi:hypothetical protein [Flavilitoribacter nigricans]|uniref:Uncharacterized protein n=1 Tax=Flavilitoribacter nigricans (strain ATCC 23147 / DSM 23189 / NBRC 102662 / NCIMB 1420 / SS-2) TaxID=1122177 RepID=A0A2D0N0Y2_FLAN2|nr:hypothetical protein [Flavilitoribacter nigricans]PHN02026.1 hypothetical protein CRP01_33870 [Flavilitoribacter nigricans DSM 23189 = NBRC 102662]